MCNRRHGNKLAAESLDDHFFAFILIVSWSVKVDSRHIASASYVDQRYRWSANHTAFTSRTQRWEVSQTGDTQRFQDVPDSGKPVKGGVKVLPGPCFRNEESFGCCRRWILLCRSCHFFSKTNPLRSTFFRAENVWDAAFCPLQLSLKILVALRMGSRAVLCTWSFKGLPRWFSAIFAALYDSMSSCLVAHGMLWKARSFMVFFDDWYQPL